MNETLKALREKFNYSQNSVAQYLGISRQMYIKYEKNDVEPPLKVITNLSALYKIPCEILIKSFESNSFDSEQKDENSQAVYEIKKEKDLELADPGMEYSAESMYYETIVEMFKKLIFEQQLKVFAQLAGIIQKRTEEIAASLPETKKEKDPLQKAFDLADSLHGNSKGWKWNREELYDREICKHRGE